MRRSVKYGLYGAVLAGLVGGTLAWVSVDKTVTLRVDGDTRKVHTTAATVNGALADAGYRVGAHDIVAPAATAKVHDGSQIVFKRGRLLRLSVDGKVREVWVTAPTVADALADLGYSTSDFSSVSRDKRLPLTPTDIDIRTPKRVTVVHDGVTQSVLTTDASVSQLMGDLGLSLSTFDRIDTAWYGPLADGQKITIVRVTQSQTTVDEPVPFPTTQQKDSSLPAGNTVVVTPGKNGVAQVTYELVYVDGKLTGKTAVSRTTTVAPVPQVVKVGTKQPVQAPPPVTANNNANNQPAAPPPVSIAVDPGSAQAVGRQMAAARGWGDDQFSCLFQLWGHESGWRVNASNGGSGAYGIPQALPGSKMGAYGADWQTNPATQIAWGLAYIGGRYGTPCGAWSYWQANGWY